MKPLINNVIALVIISAVYHGNLVISGRDNPEFKRLSQQIQEKVCAGKATDEQLKKLSKCMDDMKDDMGERDLLEEAVQKCLKEIDVDIGFTVNDDSYREHVYMICSTKFRMCVHTKSKNRSSIDGEQMAAGNNNDNEGDKGKDSGGDGPRDPPPPPPSFKNPEFNQKIQKMMECKRDALDL